MGKNRPICIALCGRTGCGKSKVAEIIETDYGYTQYSFGKPIREFMNSALPNVDYHTCPRARDIAIKVAQLPKTLNKYCWAFTLTEDILGDNCPDKIIISDLRFKEELEHISTVLPDESYNNGYKIILVRVVSSLDNHIFNYKELLDESDKILLNVLNSDPSNIEHEEFQFDYTLYNKGTEEELKNTIKKMFKDLSL